MSRKGKIPTAISDYYQIMRRTKRVPKENYKYICSECNSTLYKIKIDHGKKKEKPKAGRPKRGAIRTRYQHIGYWCAKCEIFYYLDLTPDYRERALQD